MPGGRPSGGRAAAHPELIELAAWFREALATAGYPSVNAFVQRHPFDKNPVYALVNGTRFLPLDTCRALAVALRRDPAAVDPIWWRAKQATDRQMAARPRADTVTSWAELPRPPIPLQDLLEAQAHAADQLPYRLLGVEPPPLSTVYVRQHARTQAAQARSGPKEARTEPDPEREKAATEKAIPVTAALDRNEHLVLTGEPGAGKSTFGQYLALRLSGIWLGTETAESPLIGEPVIPIRVPARALVGARSWAAGLAAAVQLTLGLRLVAEPDAALFERRLLGVRWLVVVDGLDEIVDRGERTEVLQALAARCRPGGDYRIVITTRRLPDAEFALLRSQHVQMYEVEPFGREELEVFARQWFAAQGTADPRRDAARFLRQTADGRLRDLVRNPLLATIAAISHTLDPGRPLPRNRLDLYERFFEHLLDEDTGGRDTLAELRRVHSAHPDRRRFADWLHESRRDLLRHLGRVRLDGDTPLLIAATTWADERAPVAGRPEDLRAMLTGTGLLVYEGDGLRFLHHSFAEFLAAQGHAEALGPDFEGLEAWIAKGLRPADREFCLFLMAQWCRKPGYDVSVIVDRLLLGSPERALLAGRLLAELGDEASSCRRRVLDRLFALFLFHAGRTDDRTESDPGALAPIATIEMDELSDVLGGFAEDADVAGWLAEVADDARLPSPTRRLAAHALGGCGEVEAALVKLASVAANASGPDLLAIAESATELASDDPFGLELLRRLCRDAHVHPNVGVGAAVKLVNFGEEGPAREAVAEVVLDSRLMPHERSLAVETWLAGLSFESGSRAAAAASLLGATWSSARQRAAVAEGLLKAGCPDEAGQIAMEALGELSSLDFSARSLLSVWPGSASPLLEKVVELVRDELEPRPKAYAVRGLADSGCTGEIVPVAAGIVTDPKADGFSIGQAVRGWLRAEGEGALPTVLGLLRDRGIPGISWAANIADALIEAGFPEAATRLCRENFALMPAAPYDLADWVRAWLTAGLAEAEREVVDAVMARGMPIPYGQAILAQAFAAAGRLAVAENMLDRLPSALVDLEPYELVHAAKAVMMTRGRSGAEDLLASARTDEYSSLCRVSVAEHMAALGHIDLAHRLWCTVLTRRIAPLVWISVAVERLVNTGGADAARAELDRHPDPAVKARAGMIMAAARVNEAGS